MDNKDNTQKVQENVAWYVIRTYPRYEVEVKGRLIDRLQAKNLQNPDMQILVPADNMVDDHDKQMYLGYILVQIRMQPEVWNIIRNTPGVTGFIGMGSRPTPFFKQDWMEIPFRQFPKGL